MKIAFISGGLTKPLSGFFKFDREFPVEHWGFSLGGEIFRGLVARGNDVVAVTPCYYAKGLEVRHAVSGTGKGTCELCLFPESTTKVQLLTLYSAEVGWIRKALMAIKPDVVMVNWTYQYARAALMTEFPVLVIAHDSPCRIAEMNKNVVSTFRALYARLFVVGRIRNLSAVSPYIVNEFRTRYGYKRPICVIPNGITADNANPRTPIRAQATTVVCVSDWSALKNVKTFFSALERAEKTLPHLRAVVFGNELSWNGAAGRYLKKHKMHIGCLDLRGLAPRSEIDRMLREEADLFVSPSLEESFGMVFVEAMRFGVPCIGGEKSGAVPWVLGSLEGSEGLDGLGGSEGLEGLGGSESTIQASQTLTGGVVCDVTKPEKLAECIERVMGDAELRMLLSEGGKRRVKEMFDIEKVVDMYERELERVMEVWKV